MNTPKQPEDHKKPAGEELFTFEHDGNTYTFEKSLDVVQTPKWLRENRRREQLDLVFTILEEIAGDECLKVIDSMTKDEFNELQEAIGKAANKA